MAIETHKDRIVILDKSKGSSTKDLVLQCVPQVINVETDSNLPITHAPEGINFWTSGLKKIDPESGSIVELGAPEFERRIINCYTALTWQQLGHSFAGAKTHDMLGNIVGDPRLTESMCHNLVELGYNFLRQYGGGLAIWNNDIVLPDRSVARICEYHCALVILNCVGSAFADLWDSDQGELFPSDTFANHVILDRCFGQVFNTLHYNGMYPRIAWQHVDVDTRNPHVHVQVFLHEHLTFQFKVLQGSSGYARDWYTSILCDEKFYNLVKVSQTVNPEIGTDGREYGLLHRQFAIYDPSEFDMWKLT